MYVNLQPNFHNYTGLKVVKVDLESPNIVPTRINVWRGSMGIKYPDYSSYLLSKLSK